MDKKIELTPDQLEKLQECYEKHKELLVVSLEEMMNSFEQLIDELANQGKQ